MDAVCTEFVTECFGVVSAVGGQRPQVAGVASGDLRAGPVIGFMLIVEWMSGIYSVSTSTKGVTLSARTR